MKKNKIVKPLVIATAVAAVAGIAAVSFAEWKGATTDLTVTGSTGEIVTSANITTNSNLSDTVKLVPYDQAQQFSSTTMAKVWIIGLTATSGSLSDYNYSITTESTLDLRVFTGTTYVAPGETGFNLDDWTALSATATTVTLDTNNNVYVILVSTANGDMNQSISVKITAATDGYTA